MAKLKKDVVDAILRDHRAGYSMAEIAERHGVHRNTVARRLADVEDVARGDGGKTPREAVLAALAEATVLMQCAQCGGPVPLVTSQPNAFLGGEPVGFLVVCRCGTAMGRPMDGLEEAFEQWWRGRQ